MNEYEDIIGSFGNKMGTFTGYWSVRLHPDRVDEEFLNELAEKLEANPNELKDAWFCMTELQVSRSSSRMTVKMDRPNQPGANRLQELEAKHLNPVKFYFSKEQRYFVSPY